MATTTFSSLPNNACGFYFKHFNTPKCMEGLTATVPFLGSRALAAYERKCMNLPCCMRQIAAWVNVECSYQGWSWYNYTARLCMCVRKGAPLPDSVIDCGQKLWKLSSCGHICICIDVSLRQKQHYLHGTHWLGQGQFLSIRLPSSAEEGIYLISMYNNSSANSSNSQILGQSSE